MKLTEQDFERLKQRAKTIKAEAEEQTGKPFLGGKCRDKTCDLGLLVLHINENGHLMKVELPNGALIDPS